MSHSIHDLRTWRQRGEKFVMVTAYDALTARICDEAGVPLLLVGDSVANVLLGYPNTVRVTFDEMLHHAKAVARGSRDALLVGDLPWGSYQVSTEEAIRNSSEYLRAGMHAVKLEGAGPAIDTVAELSSRGIPVMGHLGLTPQFVNAIGGFKVQGRGEAGDKLLADAKALQDAGAFAVVLEAVPSSLGKRVTEELDISTIGIGAGPDTDGQVLVLHDLLGLTPGPSPRFVKRYLDLASDISDAVKMFAKEVSEGIYPGPEHEYK
ncbi:MAG: 3-methyl-2-oxobutanoate hydroxymethyltransferase [Actinomycetota bacterium]